jgi:hypothetical protein
LTQHTPGPWKIDFPLVQTESKQLVCVMDGFIQDRIATMANAHLIAAAPNLLDALFKLNVAAVSHYFEPCGHDTPEDRDTCAQCGKDIRNEVHMRADEGHPLDRLTAAQRLASAAIAKATGES